MRFPLQVLLAFVATLGLWSVVVYWGQPNRELFGQNFLQRNVIRVEEYLRHRSDAEVVLIGSSIFERIDEASVGPRCVNLGLVKDHALTGARVIAAGRTRPRVLLVEVGLTNLEDGIGDELMAKVFAFDEVHFWSKWRLFEDRYQPSTVLFATVKSAAERARPQAAGDDGEAFARWLRRTVELHEQRPDPVLADAYARELHRVLRDLRTAGVRVWLVAPPTDVAISATPRQQEVFRLFDAVFPPADWPRLIVPGEYRTDDGVHLLRSEGERFGAALRQALAAQGVTQTD